MIHTKAQLSGVVFVATVVVSCGGAAHPAAPSTAGLPGFSTSTSTQAPPATSSARASTLAPMASSEESAHAVRPRLTGSITFMRDDAGGSPQTWIACANLAHQRQLTAVDGRGSGWSVWSPDGARIAFDTDREDSNLSDSTVINDVFTMAADGSDVRKLTDSVGLSGDPGWSPHGNLIAFEADRGTPSTQGIFVADAGDGGHARRITTPTAGTSDKAPRFSPDGMRLVFTREVGDAASTLFVVNLDGSGLRALTTGQLHPGDATWSPDGTQIAFEADLMRDGRSGPWVVASDGQDGRSLSGPQDLAANWFGFADPIWSPDGSLIMVLRGLHEPNGTFLHGGLATMRPDGTGLVDVTDGMGVEHQPDWSPRPC